MSRSTKEESIRRAVQRKTEAIHLPSAFAKGPLQWVGWGGFNGATGELVIWRSHANEGAATQVQAELDEAQAQREEN